MTDAKYKEANQLLLDAEKCLSTGWFKRRPDYEGAASALEQAANAFKYCRTFGEAVDAFTRASDAYRGADIYYMSAKMMEAAAQTVGSVGDAGVKSAELYEKAADLYLQNNSSDRACEMYEKASKLLEAAGQVDGAVRVLMEACSLYEQEEKIRTGMDTFKRLIHVLIQSAKYPEAVEQVHRLSGHLIRIDNKHLLCRNYLSAIIILLAYGDEVEAEKQFQQYMNTDGWLRSDESALAETLLNAYKNRQPEAAVELMKRPLVNFLDAPISKLLRSLRIPGGERLNTGAETFDKTQTSELCDDVDDIVDKNETDELC